MSNFDHMHEIVGRGIKTQLYVDEKNYLLINYSIAISLFDVFPGSSGEI